jgi:hypothetical protein
LEENVGTLKKALAVSFMTAQMILISSSVRAEIGFADVVLDYFDSGAGPIAGPYGGTLGSFPIPVSTSVVLGSEPGVTGSLDFLSLPTGSYVTVGFLDESIVDGVGNDIFIQEVGANGERANVFVSADGTNFTFLGLAIDDQTTAFDLSTIAFTSPVSAVKIVGLDNFGGSPGFDVVNVQVLPGSIAPPIPEPTSAILLLTGLALFAGASKVRNTYATSRGEA